MPCTASVCKDERFPIFIGIEASFTGSRNLALVRVPCFDGAAEGSAICITLSMSEARKSARFRVVLVPHSCEAAGAFFLVVNAVRLERCVKMRGMRMRDVRMRCGGSGFFSNKTFTHHFFKFWVTTLRFFVLFIFFFGDI